MKKNINFTINITSKKNSNKKIYILIGLLVLILCITGATFAYFTAIANNNDITGDMATTNLNLDIKKVTTADDTKGGIIPMSNNMIEKGVNDTTKETCIDDNGNAVCQIYKVTVTNTGSTNLFLDGYITLTGGSGEPTDYTQTNNNTTMRWAQVFCNEENGNVSNCTTVGNTTTGATDIETFTTLDNQIDITGLNQDNIKTSYTDVIGTGIIKNNTYDIINKNYIRVSDHAIINDTYNRETDVTSALVYNQYLDSNAGINSSSVYYFVVWLSETGTDQTEIITDKFFGGIVTFTSSSGNITGTFGNVKKEARGIATEAIKNLYNDGSNLTTVHIGGDNTNPEVSLNPRESIMLDNNGEYRYYGSNPNNYVLFNNELWRIISVSNVKSNELDTTGSLRVKLIRNESIGNYSWDSSDSSINSGYGVNDWTQADLNTLLNNYYYNGLDNQTCYNGRNNATTPCGFSSIGLNDESKRMIDNALWYLGGDTTSSVLANAMYNTEKGTTIYNCSTDDGACPRKTTWTGTIGLTSSSDYGYATDLSLCTKTLDLYSDTLCKDNDWLHNGNISYVTITANSLYASGVWNIRSSGDVNDNRVYNAFRIQPVIYLKSNISITEGSGTDTDPYKLL